MHIKNKSKIKNLELQLEDISPKLLFTQLFKGSRDYENGKSLTPRYINNYEIEYMLSGGGGMWIDDKYYQVQRGDIIIRKPGTYTQAIMPYDCYCIFFCITNNSLFSRKTFSFNEVIDFEPLYSNEVLDALPIHFHPIEGEKYIHLFDSILSHFISNLSYSELLIKSSILQIICNIYQDATDPFSYPQNMLQQNYSWIKESIQFIHTNYQNKIDLKAISSKVNLSPSYFHKIFKSILGITPNEYLTKYRIEKSKEILIKSSCNVSEIALKCGFDSLSYFSYVFKQLIGLSPLMYRKQYDIYKN